MFRSASGKPLYLAASGKPQRLEFFEFVGLFGSQVMALAAVGVDVEQFQRSASKCDQPAGEAACTVLANQP